MENSDLETKCLLESCSWKVNKLNIEPQNFYSRIHACISGILLFYIYFRMVEESATA